MVEKMTRKEEKERTRQRLIDALLAVARQEGIQALTTTKVAEAAGVAQSSFYFHFDGMEAAMRAAADRVGRQVRETIRDERRKIDLSNPRATIRSAQAATINALMAEPMFTQLFLRHRRDPTSALGETFASLLDESRKELAEDLARFLGQLPSPAIYAELFIGMSLAAVEGLLDGRITDRAACLDAMVHVASATLTTAPPR
jgi:AcrR family transcriptional regulator